MKKIFIFILKITPKIIYSASLIFSYNTVQIKKYLPTTSCRHKRVNKLKFGEF